MKKLPKCTIYYSFLFSTPVVGSFLYTAEALLLKYFPKRAYFASNHNSIALKRLFATISHRFKKVYISSERFGYSVRYLHSAITILDIHHMHLVRRSNYKMYQLLWSLVWSSRITQQTMDGLGNKWRNVGIVVDA